MPVIHFILKDGSRREVGAKNGASVMATAIFNNVRGVDAECGGSCACATCHVYVDDAFLHLLPAPDDMEDELLDTVAAGREAGSRLSCQLTVSAEIDGLIVRIPPTQS